MDEMNLERMVQKLKYKLFNFPFIYLGLPIGDTPHGKEAHYLKVVKKLYP